jgi:iron complex transport system permease protein
VNRRVLAILLMLALLAGAVACLRLFVGARTLDWPATSELWHLRADRLLSGAIVGAALALAGVLLQSLMRNPLASPDLIGANAGAGFAVMLTTYIAWRTGGTLFSTPGYRSMLGGISAGAAVTGALVSLALVYLLGQRRGVVEPIALILVGVMVGIIAGAGTTLIRDMMPDQGMAVARWMSGSLGDDANPIALWATAILAALVFVVALVFSRRLDASALSDDEARSLGINIAQQRLLVFLGTGLLTAGAVVIAGPIGFVGLVCPHLGRLMVGPMHKVLVPAATLLGITLIVGADVLLRVIEVQTGRLQIGTITAIVGGPVFLLLLRRERNAAWMS